MTIKDNNINPAPLIGSAFLHFSDLAKNDPKHSHFIVWPHGVQHGLRIKYPQSLTCRVTWEKEVENDGSNWGGSDGEGNSAQFKPIGAFAEIVKQVSGNGLPQPEPLYLKSNFENPIPEYIGIVENGGGIVTYEVEVHGKDIIFDKSGKFLREEE